MGSRHLGDDRGSERSRRVVLFQNLRCGRRYQVVAQELECPVNFVSQRGCCSRDCCEFCVGRGGQRRVNLRVDLRGAQIIERRDFGRQCVRLYLLTRAPCCCMPGLRLVPYCVRDSRCGRVAARWHQINDLDARMESCGGHDQNDTGSPVGECGVRPVHAIDTGRTGRVDLEHRRNARCLSGRW